MIPNSISKEDAKKLFPDDIKSLHTLKISSPSNHTLDKDQWGEGPWQQEPDEFDFIFRDILCIGKRAYFSGAWNGYVCLPNNFKIQGDKLDEIECHGGFTWEGKTLPWNENESPSFWYLGFDCSHAWDYSPAMEAWNNVHNPQFRKWKSMICEDLHYHTMEEVKEHLKKLVNQLLSNGEFTDEK